MTNESCCGSVSQLVAGQFLAQLDNLCRFWLLADDAQDLALQGFEQLAQFFVVTTLVVVDADYGAVFAGLGFVDNPVGVAESGHQGSEGSAQVARLPFL